MAAVLRPSDALDVAKRYLKNMPVEDVGFRIIDTVSKYIWMAAPWRWTIGAMPNVVLANNTQDYSLAIPADFLYLLEANQNDGTGAIPRPYEIVPAIAVGGQIGNVNSVTVIGAAGTTGTMRCFPKPPAMSGTNTIVSLYKKTSPSFTASNVFTKGALIMDDEWFPVFESGVKWLAYLFGDDPRAGAASITDGKISYTGQKAVFEADIMNMMQREKLPGRK